MTGGVIASMATILAAGLGIVLWWLKNRAKSSGEKHRDDFEEEVDKAITGGRTLGGVRNMLRRLRATRKNRAKDRN